MMIYPDCTVTIFLTIRCMQCDGARNMGLETFLFLILSQYVLKYNKIRCLGPPKKVVLNSRRVLITGGHDGEPCNVL